MANPIPSLDTNDDGVVKITSNARHPAGTKEVMIGTTRTDSDGAANARLLSLVTDINGTPSEKAYVDGSGTFHGDLGDVEATSIDVASIAADNIAFNAGAEVATNGDIAADVHGKVQHKVAVVTVLHTHAQAAAATKDVVLLTMPAQSRVLRVVADVTEVFDGGAISDCDVTVGHTAGGAEYLASFDVDTAVGTFGEVAAEIGAGLTSATIADVRWAASTVQCRFTAVGANLSELTTGRMVVYIEYVTYPVI